MRTGTCFASADTIMEGPGGTGGETVCDRTASICKKPSIGPAL